MRTIDVTLPVVPWQIVIFLASCKYLSCLILLVFALFLWFVNASWLCLDRFAFVNLLVCTLVGWAVGEC